ncbi:Uncharacterised protein [Legionella busanensis]|uniref:Uncharacterized protein n=1 Tax=Legionella busanensis TaxID=190655 RepID=A0A378JLG3_9GAMM|nr:hypothetical protein [Legionella busanensis]STX52044.1 Uncharacterised protein [Legionella busanensis]
MPLSEVYAETARDFDQRVKQVRKEAKNILSIYPHHFNDELLYLTVKSILIQNKIDAYTEVPETKWKEIINKKTLFNAILDYHFFIFDTQLFRQLNWLNSNDVPTEEDSIRIRKEFLDKLCSIRNKKFEGSTIEEAIRFKLKQATELSDVITQTNLETLKDRNTLNIIQVISNILKLFFMSIFYPFCFDPIVSNKCSMGNSVGTLWSGKSLNSVHMEHLKAKSEQLEHTCKEVNEYLDIQQDEEAEKFPTI